MCLHLEQPHTIVELLCDFNGDEREEPGKVTRSLTGALLIRGRYMMWSNNRKERDCATKLTVVHTDCVTVVCANISYVTITATTELLIWT